MTTPTKKAADNAISREVAAHRSLLEVAKTAQVLIDSINDDQVAASKLHDQLVEHCKQASLIDDTNEQNIRQMLTTQAGVTKIAANLAEILQKRVAQQKQASTEPQQQPSRGGRNGFVAQNKTAAARNTEAEDDVIGGFASRLR